MAYSLIQLAFFFLYIFSNAGLCRQTINEKDETITSFYGTMAKIWNVYFLTNATFGIIQIPIM